ncbi:MAG: 3-hydroxybutyryl-CoA dehydrogenase [Saprospiraceae bacterium]|uniref:3-hydroxybutyryl-CoA dehydrogenase n=1 Tax=Candidatus Opimibacter skivensis TaxID=2982028 RepID=A0A9D7ST08_9BACT|nr:3-hydroxybutyryl-CoA dehydrogenase [Candidatus Opimibacter skivensis]
MEKNSTKHKVAIIGAGTMGNGITHVFAQFGFPVTMIDISTEAVGKGMNTIQQNMERMVQKEKITLTDKDNALGLIKTSTDVKSGINDATLIIEAATENLDLKLKLFKDFSQYSREDAILATNTSSISITKIASVTNRPQQVIGMHFMNPVPVMKLVEIIRGYSTSDEVAREVTTISESLGKIPVVVNDYPGFVANRVLMPMLNEAIIALWEGVAGVEEIDNVMKLGMAHPMGPLQLADFIGLDVVLAILRVLQDGYGQPKYAPCPLLVNMVQAGKKGVKSGEGFYVYTPGSREMKVSEAFRK